MVNTIQKNDGSFLQAFRCCDHCAICNHSAASNVSDAQINSDSGTKFGEEGVD